MTANAMVVRHLTAATTTYLWPSLREPQREPAPEIESWLDYSEVYESVRRQLRTLKHRALHYAEAKGWNPLHWFAPRAEDSLAIFLLSRSGDLAMRAIQGQRRYRITQQGRQTLDTMRFTRA